MYSDQLLTIYIAREPGVDLAVGLKGVELLLALPLRLLYKFEKEDKESPS
jgi:hypothetical protein